MMRIDNIKSSWVALGLFYLTLVFIVTILDSVNKVLTVSYWLVQVGLITLGVGLFAFIGMRIPQESAMRSVLMVFTIGILTIIPAVLMGLGRIPGLWPQYFYIAFGMATGSFLTSLFIKFSPKVMDKKESDLEHDNLD